MRVTLFGKKIFADVINLRILKCSHPELPGWTLIQRHHVLTNDSQRGAERQIRVTQPQSRECLMPPEAERGKKYSLLELSE